MTAPVILTTHELVIEPILDPENCGPPPPLTGDSGEVREPPAAAVGEVSESDSRGDSFGGRSRVTVALPPVEVPDFEEAGVPELGVEG